MIIKHISCIMNIMIVFLILHYGDHGVTETCIKSIKGLGLKSSYEILIVDNDPNPGVWDYPHVVKSGNTGFSAANNIGYEYAKNTLKATMVIACNNDLIFEASGFEESVLLSYEDGDAYVVGPDIEKVGTGEHQSPIDTDIRTPAQAKKTIFLNKFALALYPLAYPLMRGLLSGKTQTGVKLETEGPVPDIVPCGACIVFTKKFVEREKKIFEPETKFYYEEYILAKRCRDKGFKIVYEPKLHVMHVDASSTNSAYNSESVRIKRKMLNITESCRVYLKMFDSKR